MRIIKAKDYDEMSAWAADIIAAQVTLKEDSVLGLATGSTPVGTYERLIERHKSGRLSFLKCRAVNLDEYAGLSPEHMQSYAYFMRENLFKGIDIKPENTHIPDGTVTDGDAECRRYDALIASLGGIDLQLLGIGHNGHIGFNEPDSRFAKGTNRVALTKSTIEANSRFFSPGESVPTQAYTMGIQTIFSARRILLLASGKGKAEIIKKSLFGPVTPEVPASILQFHADVIVVADEDALSYAGS